MLKLRLFFLLFGLSFNFADPVLHLVLKVNLTNKPIKKFSCSEQREVVLHIKLYLIQKNKPLAKRVIKGIQRKTLKKITSGVKILKYWEKDIYFTNEDLQKAHEFKRKEKITIAYARSVGKNSDVVIPTYDWVSSDAIEKCLIDSNYERSDFLRSKTQQVKIVSRHNKYPSFFYNLKGLKIGDSSATDTKFSFPYQNDVDYIKDMAILATSDYLDQFCLDVRRLILDYLDKEDCLTLILGNVSKNLSGYCDHGHFANTSKKKDLLIEQLEENIAKLQFYALVIYLDSVSF